MISFEGRAPAWDNIPALSVTAVGDLTEGGKSLLVQTDAGPLQISLYSFGARLRLGVRQFGDYGMLVEEPDAMALNVESAADTTVITGAGYRLEMHHNPFSFELFTGDCLIQRSPKDGHFVRQFVPEMSGV